MPRKDLKLEQLFWPGALTATGPGCHHPQNKGKCVGGRKASAVFFKWSVNLRSEGEVSALRFLFDTPAGSAVRRERGKKLQDLRQVISSIRLRR